MKKLILLVLTSLFCCITANEHQAQWSAYKDLHGKTYGLDEEPRRQSVFMKNDRLIREHNEKAAAGEVSYELGHNEFSDVPPEERHQLKWDDIPLEFVRSSHNASRLTARNDKLPRSVDWRGTAVTPVKNEGACESSYAFAAVGLVESALMLKYKKPIILSEQQVIDCSFGYFDNDYNFGCDSGYTGGAILWIHQNGIALESDYPFVSGKSGKHGQCKKVPSIAKGQFKIGTVLQYDEKTLARVVAKYGPVMALMSTTTEDFALYRGGVYDNPKCKTEPDTGVLIVGYGEENGKEFWIVKNSRGESWGDHGFAKIARGKNRCGITTSYSHFIGEFLDDEEATVDN